MNKLTPLILTIVVASLLTVARLDASVQAADAKATTKAPPAARFDPVLRDIEGWKLYVEPALLDGEHNRGASINRCPINNFACACLCL